MSLIWGGPSTNTFTHAILQYYMHPKFIAACVQMESKIGLHDTNLVTAKNFILEAIHKTAKLILLPECFDHGYDIDYMKKTENFQSEKTLSLLSNLAVENGVTIIGGFPFKLDSQVYNSCGAFLPNGKIVRYNKCHLISMLREPDAFKSGQNQFIIQSPLIKVSPLICFDLRFPEISRNVALHGAQILTYAAAWPKVRIDAWKKLLQARAIENQMYVMGANLVGCAFNDEIFGNSLIANPLGEVIAVGSDSKQELVLAEIDLNFQEEFRKQKPFLTERRPDLYSKDIVHV